MIQPMSNRVSVFRPWQISCAWILLIAGFVASCSSFTPPSLPSLPSLGPPGEDEEVRISREFRREAKKHFKFVNNPEMERYVDGIGQRILSAMGPQPFDYRFFVVEDSQLNAFAVPGGSIYIYTGLIERAKSTNEIAGVLGHEITHIKNHHMARSSGPDAISILSLLSMVLLARSGSGAQAAGAVGQAISATRQIAYSRQLEMEADTLGVRYMAAAGYDPKGSLGFLKTLDQERALNPVDIPPYLMTHPMSQERVANMEQTLRSLGKTEIRSEQPDPLKKVQIVIRMERHDGDAVLGEYEKLVRQNPQSPELLQLLGFAQQLIGQLPEAQKNYEKARQLNPNNAGLQRDLGRLYTRLGNVAGARVAFDRAIALEPKEPLTYLYLGELFENEGDLRSAAGAYLNANNFSPTWDKPPYRLGVVYGKLNRLGDAYYYLGRSALLQDEDQKAIADFEKAIKLAGENSPRGQLIKEELAALRAKRR
jgi:beta-barrel assembly-enhancing protease